MLELVPDRKIPQFGDKEMRSTDIVVRPSTERMPFGPSGELRPTGPAPLREVRFYEAPDLAKFPQWERRRGNEWTTPAFRAVIFDFIRDFMRARPWALRWKVVEVASSVRSMLRLPDDEVHLVFSFFDGRGTAYTTAISFPGAREDRPAAMAYRLSLAARSIDALRGTA